MCGVLNQAEGGCVVAGDLRVASTKGVRLVKAARRCRSGALRLPGWGSMGHVEMTWEFARPPIPGRDGRTRVLLRGDASMVNETDRWKARLRERIRAAMKAREASLLAMWREVLALVENAEAVPVASSAIGVSDDAPFAGSIAGLGSAEATRRVLSSDEVRTLLVADVAERRSAAGGVRSGGVSRLRGRLAGPGRCTRGLPGREPLPRSWLNVTDVERSSRADRQRSQEASRAGSERAPAPLSSTGLAGRHFRRRPAGPDAGRVGAQARHAGVGARAQPEAPRAQRSTSQRYD